MSPFSLFLFFFSSLALLLSVNPSSASPENSINQGDDAWGSVGKLVKKEDRKLIVSTDYGEISAADIGDGVGKRSYHLQFIKLDPNALLLPVFLHTDMVFYVHTGSGRLSWMEKDEILRVKLERGDVYRLRSGTIFYIQSDLEPERYSLRINAIFTSSDQDLEEPSVGVYSSIHDLVRGFDKRVLQAAFKVSEDLVEELTTGARTPPIVHVESKKKKSLLWDKEVLLARSFLGVNGFELENKKKKHHQKSKTKCFNIFKEDPDFKNCNGWSKVVTTEDLNALDGSGVSVIMVNLTKGSMMGPHWNPTATEIAVVLEGRGMIRVACASRLTKSECSNSRFRVKEGDVFMVPRFHPMTQISFNNDSLVFMGFSTSTRNNRPQFLAGKASVLQVLDRDILEASFNVANGTVFDQLLAARDESVVLDCTSCAEEEEVLLEEEIETGREEGKERRRREEEEERRREEEERRRQEEEQRRREEEERRREEEEQRRREEEERRRQEEEQRRREEEERQQKEEEEEEKRRQVEEEEETREEPEAGEEEEEEEARRPEEEEGERGWDRDGRKRTWMKAKEKGRWLPRQRKKAE